MALRVKELCKEKGMTMTELAKKIKVHPVTLTQSLNGNPTLSRLKTVADALGVEVSELFSPKKEDTIYGCLYVNGEPHIVESIKQIKDLLDKATKKTTK